MSLYDDDEDFNEKHSDEKKEELAGWSKGIKLLQSHMKLKKAAVTLPKREQVRKQAQTTLNPVFNFKKSDGSNSSTTTQPSTTITSNTSATTTVTKLSKLISAAEKEEHQLGSFHQPEKTFTKSFTLPTSTKSINSGKKRSKRVVPSITSVYLSIDPEWQIENEYDPMWPNEYDKALKDLRVRRDKEAEEEEAKRKLQEEKDGIVSEERDENTNSPSNHSSNDNKNRGSGVSIAPPPSLMSVGFGDSSFEKETSSSKFYGNESNNRNKKHKKDKGMSNYSGGNFGLVSSDNNPTSSGGGGGGSSAAARIMAKYGYKEGQGLGKKEQGMSTALLVEKTSYKTGRIIHEKDLLYKYQQDQYDQNQSDGGNSSNSSVLVSSGTSLLPAYSDESEIESFNEYGNIDSENQQQQQQQQQPEAQQTEGPSLAELLKSPSKVVLLKNMVGPGEVDDDLEPEVKDECNTKYGEVLNVTIYEMPEHIILKNNENSIRIFVEFNRVESAVKALVDLNGRFFGGRQVMASFYDNNKYNNLELTEN